MESAVKRKVTVRLEQDNEPHKQMSRPPSPSKLFMQGDPSRSRPPSPSKLFTTESDQSLFVPRPKAKVNSAASLRKTPSVGSSISIKSSKTNNASPNTYRSGARTNASNTPRAASPLKAPECRNGASSPFKLGKTRVTVHTTQLVAATPQRSLTAVASEASLRNTGRRRGSMSFHNDASMVSIDPQASLAPPAVTLQDTLISPQDGSDSLQVGAGLMKVKSKVTGMAKYDISSSLLSSPESNTYRISSPRARAPSISSNTSFVSTTSSPSLDNKNVYPITTATAAANPHRFATTRASPPSTARHYYQPFPLKDDLFINYGKQSVGSKVDPATIPLPPHSPPTSVLSFSSQSSRSQSSISYRTENAGDSQSSLPTLGSPTTSIRRLSFEASPGSRLASQNGTSETCDYTSAGDQGIDGESDLGLESEERKIKAEAKSNRKIADLEITNRSLLAINASLEAAKHSQAREIRDLRRKLRESRLILPPLAYQAVKVSLDHDDSGEDDEEDEEDEEEERKNGETGDESYKRITVMLERLIETGKSALEAKPASFPEGGKGGAKVLSAEEVRSWRDSGGDPDETKDGIPIDRPPTPSHIAVPQSDDEFLSEEEVEAMALPTDSTPVSPARSAPPPIHITVSP